MCNNLIPFLGCIINEWRNETRLSHQIRQQDNLVPRFLSREQKDVEIGGIVFFYIFSSLFAYFGHMILLYTCWFESIGALLDSCFLSLNYIFFHVLLNCNFLKINISHGFKSTIYTSSLPLVHRTVVVFCPCACAVERRIPVAVMRMGLIKLQACGLNEL